MGREHPARHFFAPLKLKAQAIQGDYEAPQANGAWQKSLTPVSDHLECEVTIMAASLVLRAVRQLTEGVRFCSSCGATVGGQPDTPHATWVAPRCRWSRVTRSIAQAPGSYLRGAFTPRLHTLSRELLHWPSPIILNALAPQIPQLLSFSARHNYWRCLCCLWYALRFRIEGRFFGHTLLSKINWRHWEHRMEHMPLSHVVPNAIKYNIAQPKNWLQRRLDCGLQQRIDAETNKAGKH